MKYLSIQEVEFLAHRLAQELFSWDEPIPDFGTRFPNILESCLVSIRQSAGGKIAYRGMRTKAAVLFYLMIKNHPFQNGNKRIAVTSLLCFMSRNGKWIEVNNRELYNLAKWVAESNPKLKDATIQGIDKFIQLYMVDY